MLLAHSFYSLPRIAVNCDYRLRSISMCQFLHDLGGSAQRDLVTDGNEELFVLILVTNMALHHSLPDFPSTDTVYPSTLNSPPSHSSIYP